MNFYYRVMPFGLKKAKAIYQQLMNKVFVDQIGRNIEVYVDDMVAKTSEKRRSLLGSRTLSKSDDTT